MSTIANMANCHPIPDTAEPLFDIQRIEKYFEGKSLPERIDLDEVTHITDVGKMIKSHIEFLRGKDRKPIYYVYYERLTKIAKLI